jgi:hypothetical protein
MNVSWFINKCHPHRETIALMAAGLCPDAEKQPAEQHLQTCPDCREYARELAAVTGKISRLSSSHPTIVPSGNLHSRWTGQILGNPPQLDPYPRSPAAGRRNAWFAQHRARFAWSLATAACIITAFVIGDRHGRSEPTDPLLNPQLVRETLAMFPGQVRAIVRTEHGMSLVLADQNNIPASAPLYIRICDGNRCSSFLTFSGQDITVAGQKITVLADSHGGVILAGDHFLWNGSEKVASADGWKIETKNLGRSLM